jgi:membrane protease YdiL (CAAX protease family)
MPATPLFAQTRRVSWSIIGLTIVAYACANFVLCLAVFHGPVSDALGKLYASTGFIIRSTLVGGVFCLLAVGPILYVAGLRASDIGWVWSKVLVGMFVTLGLWAATNASIACLAAVRGGIVVEPAWKQGAFTALAGALVGQLLGNALAEETVFRGFLLPQFYLKMVDSQRSGAALAIALIGSSLLFALSHIAQRLLIAGFAGSDLLPDQLGLFFFGIYHALIYVVTRHRQSKAD